MLIKNGKSYNVLLFDLHCASILIGTKGRPITVRPVPFYFLYKQFLNKLCRYSFETRKFLNSLLGSGCYIYHSVNTTEAAAFVNFDGPWGRVYIFGVSF